MLRREFLRKTGEAVLGLACGACLGPLAGCVQDTEAPQDPENPPPFKPVTFHNVNVALDLSDPSYAVLSQPRGAARTTVDVEGSPSTVILSRQGDGTLMAFSATCSHAGCTVNAPSGTEIECPCHGSRYGLDGNVIRGPAASPLTPIPVTLQENTAVLQFRRLS